MVSSIIPKRNHQVHFQSGDVKEHFGAISIFQGLTYRVKGRSMLLVPDRFRKPSDLFNMLHVSDSKKYTKNK